MQFNKVRSYIVPLKADELLGRLDAAINHECKGEFYFFLLQYRFHAHKNSNYFTLAPTSRGIVIEGFLMDNNENECCVNIRLMPPVWVGFYLCGFLCFFYCSRAWGHITCLHSGLFSAIYSLGSIC